MSAKQNLQNLPAVVYLPTRMMHAAYAAGSIQDGSLYGMFTLCQRRIGDDEIWHEVDKSNAFRDAILWPDQRRIRPVNHCKQCQKIIDKNRRDLDAA